MLENSIIWNNIFDIYSNLALNLIALWSKISNSSIFLSLWRIYRSFLTIVKFVGDYNGDYIGEL